MATRRKVDTRHKVDTMYVFLFIPVQRLLGLDANRKQPQQPQQAYGGAQPGYYGGGQPQPVRDHKSKLTRHRYTFNDPNKAAVAARKAVAHVWPPCWHAAAWKKFV